jgi:hypothetical protein
VAPQKCKRKFVTLQPNEPVPYIEELVAKIGEYTADLEPHQIYVFYEAVGTMLSEKGANIPIDRALIQVRACVRGTVGVLVGGATGHGARTGRRDWHACR